MNFLKKEFAKIYIIVAPIDKDVTDINVPRYGPNKKPEAKANGEPNPWSKTQSIPNKTKTSETNMILFCLIFIFEG